MISGGAGIIAGPVGGLTTIPKKLAVGAAVGCGVTLASQQLGGRQDNIEGAAGCGFGAVGAVLPGDTWVKSFVFGTINSVAQAVTTYSLQNGLGTSNKQR